MATNSSGAIVISMSRRTVSVRPALRYVFPSFVATIIRVPFLLLLLVVVAACDRGATPEAVARVAARDGGEASDNGAAPGPDRQAAGTATTPDRRAAGTIVFIGTSLTAGYGLGEEYAYPALIQARIDDAGLPFRVVNAGVSGETSAGGLRRIDWVLQNPVDVLVVELGANDALRGLDVAAMRTNLRGILERTRDRYPDAALVLLGMEAPPNLGGTYRNAFRQTYRDIADEFDAALLPFLLEGVAARPTLNLDDRIHPNAEGQKILARNVWEVLEGVLRERTGAR
jgi:acyl-CoA thioesterase I